MERRIRERAARAMFPHVSYDSPMWRDFVVGGVYDANSAVCRVAREMELIEQETKEALSDELAELRRETASTVPPRGTAPEETVKVKTGPYAGAVGTIESFSSDGYLVLLKKCPMLPAGGLFTFKLSDLEPSE